LKNSTPRGNSFLRFGNKSKTRRFI